MTKLKVGDKAPNFSLPSNIGPFALSQYLTKKNIVIFFYPMDESPVCSKEAEAFKNKLQAFNELDAVVIGISPQGVESHKSFASRHSLPYILLSDPKGVFRKLYGISTTLGILPERKTFVIDKQGIVRHIFSSQLKPTKHADEALNSLRKSRGDQEQSTSLKPSQNGKA